MKKKAEKKIHKSIEMTDKKQMPKISSQKQREKYTSSYTFSEFKTALFFREILDSQKLEKQYRNFL